MSQEPTTQDYCAARSGGIERVQQMAERRLDGHGAKIDDLTRACLSLTAAVERVTLILEKQDQRLDRVENRSLLSFLESNGGKALLRYLGILLMLLLGAGLGVNVLQIITEVFS